MSREDRDIVLDGQMPASIVGIMTEDQAMAFLSTLSWVEAVEVCYNQDNEHIAEVVTACETDCRMFTYEPVGGATFSQVWNDLAVFRRARATREAEASRQADVEFQQRQEANRERQRMQRDVAALVTSLTDYGAPRVDIVAVLQGDPAAIGAAAVLVRHVASVRENEGRASSNSHSNTIELLRRSSIPGSDEALNFLSSWTQDTHRENPERDVLAAEADELIRRAQAGERVSTGVILERLGIAAPPEQPVRLGQAVDMPAQDIGAAELAEIAADCRHGETVFTSTPREQPNHYWQSVARSTFKSALFELLHRYDGDVAYVASTFAGYMIDYGTANTDRSPDGLSSTTAQEMIIAAAALTSVPLDILVPPRLRSRLSISEEQGNEHAGQTENTPTDQLGESSGPGAVLGRDGGKHDDPSSTDPANPAIIRL